MTKKILFIGGSLNQTTIVYEVYKHLKDYDCYFTPYYADGALGLLGKTGLLDRTIIGYGPFWQTSFEFLKSQKVKIDIGGKSHNYDLVLTCNDMVIPNNIKNKNIILIQEGMTDPENWFFRVTKQLGLPYWISGNTAAFGLSDKYRKFCVASEGYADHFVEKGIKREKVVVTGIPNYDNASSYAKNDFPHRGFVLVATSDMRETLKYENRKKFIQDAVDLANGRLLIFKLHPNENHDRATKEINKYAPNALVYPDGNIHQMIANCDVLITRFSTTVYTGLALGKQVYSEFNLNSLKKLLPLQNGGRSGEKIAEVCRSCL